MLGERRRIKRRLLHDLVHENVELKSGRGRPRPRRRSRLRGSLKVASLLAAPAAVLASSLVLSGAGAADRNPGPLAPPTALANHGPGSSTTPRGLPPAPAPAAAAVAAAPLPAMIPDVSAGSVDAAVFPLAVRRIVLDPGHGGGNRGTRTPGGLEEKFLTLDIARRVRGALEGASYEVLMTRDGDQALTLEERAAFANQERADIFVSIHVNWFEGVRGSGIETYYLGPTDDPFLTRLAASENTDSGHTLAEMRALLDRIYAGVRQDKSQRLAREIHTALFGSLSRVNPQLRDRGVKTAPFLVLVDTEMPAILAEVAALSSAAEAAMLEKPLYRDYIADSLARGIITYAESVSTAPPQQKGS
jgi:N-acetylmuramoyl-L-alanine amidase